MVGTGKILLLTTLIVTLNSCLENKSPKSNRYVYQASHIDSILNVILTKTNLSEHKNISVWNRYRLGKDAYIISDYYSNLSGYYLAKISDSGVIKIDSSSLDSSGWISVHQIKSIVKQLNELNIPIFASDTFNNMFFSRSDLYGYQFAILNNPDKVKSGSLNGYKLNVVNGNKYELIKQF